MRWPPKPSDMERLQTELSSLRPDPCAVSEVELIGGCFVCFPRHGRLPGGEHDRAWAASVVLSGGRQVAEAVTIGSAGAPYRPGLLAAREGPPLETAVRALPVVPDLLVVNAAGRDHPRRAGLALHLGWVVDIPTVGVTHRPLLARGECPGPWAGSRSPLLIGDEQVGWWLRTRVGARPLAVSPGWRTDLSVSWEVVMMSVSGFRTPEPIRRSRRLARTARALQ